MHTPHLIPYLNFNGSCKEAVEFYKNVFGGELEITTFEKGMPGMPHEDGELIMHAHLKSEGFELMASDNQPDSPVTFGNSVYLSLNGTDLAWHTEVFNKLCEGGEVLESLQKQMWGDTFGMCIDKFGHRWMTNVTTP